MKKLIFLAAVLISPWAHGQAIVAITNDYKTKIEAFSAKPDAVIVKSSTTIGVIARDVAHPIEIRAEEAFNVSTSNRLYGVAIRIKTERGLSIDHIDYDELGSLIEGIQTILQSGHTQLDNYDAYFRTRSGFVVAKYSNNDKISASLKSGSSEAVQDYVDTEMLKELSRNLSISKDKLDTLRRDGN